MDPQPRKISPLTTLIYATFVVLFLYVGFNLANCNLMIPGTMHYANVKGELKNPPPIDCNKSQEEGIRQLLVAIGLLIAYKAKSDD
jgi:hypothetical protein